MIDLTPILQAVIALLAALVTYKLVPWLKSKTTAQQQETLARMVDVLVYAAEQIYTSDQSQAKLMYVKQQLKDRGYVVDLAQIEAAVRRMNEQSNHLAVGIGEELETDDIE